MASAAYPRHLLALFLKRELSRNKDSLFSIQLDVEIIVLEVAPTKMDTRRSNPFHQ